jgi:hypothetical protein
MPTNEAHVCTPHGPCTCDTYALEPSEQCTVHGSLSSPPRCYDCGRFLKYDRFPQHAPTRAATSEIQET